MKKKFFVQTTKLNNNICFYDLETGGNDPFTCEPIELFAVVVDAQNFAEKENGRFGPVIIKPTDMNKVQDAALAVNKITREQLAEGKDQETVFREFCAFCRMFQAKDSKWDACYSGGFNIRSFDDTIMRLLCKKYGYVDGDNSPKLFHPIHCFDLIEICRLWFHNSTDGPSGYSLTAIREFFGISTVGAHTSEQDTLDTLAITKRLIQFQRKLSDKYVEKFKNSFSGMGNNKTENGV